MIRLPASRCLQSIVLSAAVFGAGCVSHSGNKAAQSDFLDDRVTAERIELGLRSQNEFNFSQVRVQASGTTVYLSGQVSSAEARQYAEKLAQSSSRTTRVENRLQVRASTAQPRVAPRNSSPRQ